MPVRRTEQTHFDERHPGAGGDVRRGGPPQGRISRAEAQDGANNPLVATGDDIDAVDAEHPGGRDSAGAVDL